MRATLIFDLDGTLSDPFEGIARCYEHALATHGYPVAPRSELAKLIGPPLDDGMRKLGVPDAEIPAVVATYRVRYSSHGYAENRVYDGIAEALATLGGRLGVCTSKRVDFAERILELFRLREHFAFVSGADIGTTKAQQLAALLANGTIDREAIMIGDRAVDLEAAHANGLASCGVLWGFGSREELEAAKPRYLLETPGELVERLGR